MKGCCSGSVVSNRLVCFVVGVEDGGSRHLRRVESFHECGQCFLLAGRQLLRSAKSPAHVLLTALLTVLPVFLMRARVGHHRDLFLLVQPET